jgi:hypothetical protein
MNPVDNRTAQAQMEILRRRANQPASSAGIGADMANSLNPGNPIAAGGTQMMTNPTAPEPSMAGGAGGSPSAEAIGQMKQEKGEAQTIVDALIYRLRRLSNQEQAPQGLGVI